MVSLFTRVPLKPTLELLATLFPEATIRLFEFVLQTTYFVYNEVFHVPVLRVAMGSPLIADFYMEAFEKQALESALLKPGLYPRFVDDILVIWMHGEAALDSFVPHLNGFYVAPLCYGGSVQKRPWPQGRHGQESREKLKQTSSSMHGQVTVQGRKPQR